MQSTFITTHCCFEIEKIMRKFIWGYSDTHRGVNLVKWADLCQPLENGGCGLLCIESQNKAFLSKLIFKLVSQPDLLWVKVLRSIS